MIEQYESLSEAEFHRLFNEALYAFEGNNLYFRKAKHGNSFIRAEC